MSNSPQHHPAIEEDSIDVVALLATLWQQRKWILKTTALFAIFGIIVAVLSPVTFKASTVFVPQLGTEVKAPSGLSSLASLAGINLSGGSQGGEISPLLYPNLSSNIPFKLGLLNESVLHHSGQTDSLSTYLLNTSSGFSSILGTVKKYTIGLPSLLFSSNDVQEQTDTLQLIVLTGTQKELVEILSEKYSVSVNEKEGYVSVSATDKDPVVAAELVRLVTANLQDEIINKRLEKVRNNLEFTQTQYHEKKREFERIQDKLATFKDRNQNISSSLFLNELERLQAQYSIALNVVTELASQVESAKLQVNRDTPIFSVIEPVTVPTERDAPKRKLIVLIWLFLGVVISCGFVLVKGPAKEIIGAITKNT